MGVLFPTILTWTNAETLKGEVGFSRAASVLLFLTYVAFLYFQIITHPHAYDEVEEEKENDEKNNGGVSDHELLVHEVSLLRAALEGKLKNRQSPQPKSTGECNTPYQHTINTPSFNTHPINTHPINTHPINTHPIHTHPFNTPSQHSLTHPYSTHYLTPLPLTLYPIPSNQTWRTMVSDHHVSPILQRPLHVHDGIGPTPLPPCNRIYTKHRNKISIEMLP